MKNWLKRLFTPCISGSAPRRRTALRVEALEDRLTPASFVAAGNQLVLLLNTANESVGIVSNGDSYALTLDGTTWAGSNSANVTGNGNATLTVTSAGLAAFDLIQISDAATGAAVAFNDSGANAYTDAFTVNLDDTPAPVTFNGSTSFGGTAGLTVVTTANIVVSMGAGIATVDGDVMLSANRQMTPADGPFVGIDVNGGTLTTSGAGDLRLEGRGAGGVSGQIGVRLRGGTTVSSTGTGAIALDGQGAPDGIASNQGVTLTDAGTLVTSSTGAITITGQGGGVTSAHVGIALASGAVVSSTGTGAGAATITLNGTGGPGTSSNFGVSLAGTGTRITSVDGAIHITGQGGSGASISNGGVLVGPGASVSSTGTGANAATITIEGTGGAAQDGLVGVTIRTATVTSVDGDIRIVGQGGSGAAGSNQTGIALVQAGMVTSTGTGAGAAMITLEGTGGMGGSNNHGVQLASSVVVTSVVGAIQITGQGGTGTGNGNVGVILEEGVQVTSTGMGTSAATITIDGTGGSGDGDNNTGILLNNSGATVTSVDGAIQLLGAAGVGASTALRLLVNSQINVTGVAPVSLSGDSIEIAAGAAIAAGMSPVTLKTKTAGGSVGIDIGTETAGSLSLTDDELDRITAGTIVIGDESVPSRIAVTNIMGHAGDANFQVVTARNIVFNGEGAWATVDGDLTFKANVGTTATAGNFVGVDVNGGGNNSFVRTTGTGEILLQGRGGRSGPGNIGVQVRNGATVASTAAGTLTLEGFGGAGTSANHGVLLSASTIASVDGAILLAGTAGGGADSTGAVLVGSATPSTFLLDQTALGTRNLVGDPADPVIVNGITLTVIGINPVDDFVQVDSDGVFLQPNTTVQFQFDAAVTVTGYTVGFINPGTTATYDFVASGSSAVDQPGSPTGDYALMPPLSLLARETLALTADVAGSNPVTQILSLTATGGHSQIVTTGAAPVTLSADSMDLGGVITAGMSTVTLKTNSADGSVGIDIGTETAGSLSLTDAELNRISAAALIVGDFSGAIDVTADIALATATNVTLNANTDVRFLAGLFNTGGGALAIDASAVIPTRAGTDVVASALSFGIQLDIGIEGTTVDTEYDQLNVTGTVDLTDAALNLVGTHVPAVGETFTIVSASAGVTGPFEQLPQGAVFLFNGAILRISYGANDVTLTALADPPATLLVDEAGNAFDGDFSTGRLSLREAMTLANLRPDHNTIRFDATVFGTPQTITLAAAAEFLPGIEADLTLEGPGAALLTIDASALDRITSVNPGVTASISGVTLTNGRAANGSAVFNSGDLTLDGVVVSNHTTSNNGKGGGVFNNGLLRVNRSTFAGNSTGLNGRGGALFNEGGVVMVSNSTFSSNSAQANGGAVYSEGGALTVVNSTFSGNSSGREGGGLFIGGLATFRNVTIVDNHANTNDADVLDPQGGGVFHASVTTIFLYNSLVAGNVEGLGELASDLGGDPVEAVSSNNLIGAPNTAGGLTTANGNILGDGRGGVLPLAQLIDLVLSENGGPTRTHALAANSPALNAGSNVEAIDDLATELAFDQRGTGFKRIVGDAVDIGAFEVQAVFSGSFDGPDGSDLGDEFLVTSGRFTLMGGKAVAQGGRPAQATVEGNFTNVAIDLDVTLAGNGSRAGVIARYTPKQGNRPESYYWGRLIKRDGRTFAEMLRYKNGVVKQLGRIRVDLPGDTGRLRFEVFGSSLKLFVDSELVLSATDNGLSGPGLTGIRAKKGAGLDNLVVNELSEMQMALQASLALALTADGELRRATR